MGFKGLLELVVFAKEGVMVFRVPSPQGYGISAGGTVWFSEVSASSRRLGLKPETLNPKALNPLFGEVFGLGTCGFKTREGGGGGGAGLKTLVLRRHPLFRCRSYCEPYKQPLLRTTPIEV